LPLANLPVAEKQIQTMPDESGQKLIFKRDAP
jgi:hypothetical protein